MLGDAVALFGAGVASFLAPCVVPLVPAYLGMIGASATDRRSTGRAIGATLAFVAGFAVVFASLGTAAGVLGSSLDDAQDWIRRVGGVLVLVFGLALLGILRGPLARSGQLIERLPAGDGLGRAFVVGVAFGAAWSPCVGPLLGAALVAAATHGDPVQGGVLLFSYACGIGVPFVLATLTLESWPAIGQRLRALAPRLERVAGVLLIVLGVLLVTGWYDALSSYLAEFTPSVAGL